MTAECRLLVRELVLSAVPRLRTSPSRAAPVDAFIARAEPSRDSRAAAPPATTPVHSKPPRTPPRTRAVAPTEARAPRTSLRCSLSGVLFRVLNVRHRPRDRHVPAPEARKIRLAGACARRADPFPVRAVGVATPPSSVPAVGPFDNAVDAGDGNIPTALPRAFPASSTKRPPPTPLSVPSSGPPLTHRAPSPPVRERRRAHSPRSTRPR